MSEKVVNDMVAQAKSVAEHRGRNPQWVERAIRESVSATETEALKDNVIDLIAQDTDDLIRQLNGRSVAGKGTLHLETPRKTVLEEDLRTKILKTISSPNIAYILLMLGLAGLYFEFSHPGAVFPGVVGGICLVLAFFALQTLPVNYAGIMLIALAIIFFIMEMKIASYGLLSVAGIISLLLGSLMLFEGESPENRLAWGVLAPTLILISGFFTGVAFLVFRSQVSRPVTGSAGLVGEIGVVKQALAPAARSSCTESSGTPSPQRASTKTCRCGWSRSRACCWRWNRPTRGPARADRRAARISTHLTRRFACTPDWQSFYWSSFFYRPR